MLAFSTRTFLFSDEHVENHTKIARVFNNKHSCCQVDTESVFSELAEPIMGVPATRGTNMAASFGHLADGYDAQYYGYLVSTVWVYLGSERWAWSCGDRVHDVKQHTNCVSKVLELGDDVPLQCRKLHLVQLSGRASSV